MVFNMTSTPVYRHAPALKTPTASDGCLPAMLRLPAPAFDLRVYGDMV